MVRKRWLRRVVFLATGLLAALGLMGVGLWLALPAIIETQTAKFARRLGLEEASVDVARADAFALQLGASKMRKGGLSISLEQAGADYSIRRLLAGQVDVVRLDGVEVKLDFKQPRQGLLPDAVTDLLESLPESDGPLVWPVGRLDGENCRLVLELPESTETIAVAIHVSKGADDTVSFRVDGDHPRHAFHLSGRMRTETMDGTIELENAHVTPTYLLNLLRSLGVYSLPDNIKLDTGDVAASGSATLSGGTVVSFSLNVDEPEVDCDIDGNHFSASEIAITASRTASGGLAAKARAVVAALSASADWSTEATQVRVSLEGGELHAAIDPVSARWGQLASARFSLEADGGIPQLGGEPRGKVTIAIDDAHYGAFAFAPISVSAAGWLDRISITVPALGLATDTPATLRDVSVTVMDPLGGNRQVEVATSVFAEKALASRLPAGWKVTLPEFPAEALRLESHLTWSEEGPNGIAVLTGQLPSFRVEDEGNAFSAASNLKLELKMDPLGVAAAGTTELSDIQTDLPRFIPGVKAMSFGVEVPRVSFSALAELAARQVPRDDVACKLTGTVSQSETTGYAYLDVHHFGASSDWTAEVWTMLDNLNGSWAGTEMKGTRVELTIDSGRTPDERVGEWLGTREVVPLLRTVLPQLKLNLAVTADELNLPQEMRADWSGAWISKPAAAEDSPPLVASLTAYSGAVRAGPESIEKPTLELRATGDFEDLKVTSVFETRVDGALLHLDDKENVRLDLDKLSAEGSGTFNLRPFTVVNSSVVSRWVPEARGISVGATLSASGKVNWSTSGDWDGSAEIRLSDGQFDYPDQELHAEGIHTDVVLTSLKNLRTLENQPFGFSRFALGDVEVTDGEFRYAAEGLHRVVFDSASARIFGGNVAVGSFALEFPAPDVGINLEFEGLDASQLMRQIKIFRGSLTGRLRGKLPLGLLAGKPVVGEGYLELDPRVPSTFSMDASGLFTTDLPNRTTVDKVSRLPYELAEEALSDVAIKTLHIDLFRNDLPETPIRLEFKGVSDTKRARVPVDVVTNVNGSLSQTLDFLMRLARL